MINNKILSVFLTGIFTFAPLAKEAKDNAVVLKMDYNGKHQCGYTVDYTSKGNFKQKNAVSIKTTDVRCVISAAHEMQDLLFVKVDSITIKSDLYKEDVKKDLREKLLKSNHPLSLVNGFPSIDTSAELPAEGYLEWDLYRQLAKLLPTLPGKPIKPGFSWERTFTLPLRTARGLTPCEVYRSYTFKKLVGDTAMISWNFKYTAGKEPAANADALNQIPVAGKGSGSALLDVRNRCIIKAEMDFATPIAVVGDVSVTWQEKAVCTLVNCK
jgi:hypothetical protein